VRREPHHLIFAGVDLEAGEVGHGRIKQTKRMRKANLLEYLKTVTLTQSGRCRRPFTDTIHGENHGLVERRRIEGRGRMAQMMFGEKQPGTIELLIEFPKLLSQQALLEQLF